MEILDWDVAAAGNGFAAPDGFPEGMNYSDVNNAAREIMAVIARWYGDTNGSLSTSGTGNTYTLTSNRTISSYTNGLTFVFRADRANTGAVTLNVSGIGAVAVVTRDDNDLVSGDFQADGQYTVRYSSTLTKWVIEAQSASETSRGVIELATEAEATAGTDTGKAVTAAGVAASITAGVYGAGIGQTLQDVSGTRSSGVQYTNSTGSPIVVYVAMSINANQNHQAYIDSQRVSFMHNQFGDRIDRHSITLIVPDTFTYQVDISSGAILEWRELRA